MPLRTVHDDRAEPSLIVSFWHLQVFKFGCYIAIPIVMTAAFVTNPDRLAAIIKNVSHLAPFEDALPDVWYSTTHNSFPQCREPTSYIHQSHSDPPATRNWLSSAASRRSSSSSSSTSLSTSLSCTQHGGNTQPETALPSNRRIRLSWKASR